ncbi:uncharacterized protein LOC121387645 [Gigantopelta aegis]|uniref:uncharacterized protein LOC121387645 n=1 Tax=Gigantopelta aegis TaxID=1735272 RepID=UPI001B88763F|nr:uncharacterized protein LOC121387645 [Gigantopelta aegis]
MDKGSICEGMTIEQLKDELQKRGVKLSGRKRDLVERLEAYRRNDNFGNANDLAKEFNMEISDVTNYKDINLESQLPAFPFERIETYLQPLGKVFDKNPKDLYDGCFFKFVRYVSDGDLVFVRSMCKAEMKKNLTYTVDISFDTFGCVRECQCECGAGMGPEAHCKHVCTLLYAMSQFYERKSMKMEETCTQKLQSFHRTKKFIASPIKSFDLNLTGTDKTDYRFDPRKPQYNNPQQTNTRLETLVKNKENFGQMPISQLYKPCDMETYAHDHSYFGKSNEDCFLESALITDISDEQIRVIEVATRKQSSCKRWYKGRCKRLQTSRFGQICKATERTNFPMLARALTKSSKISTAPIKHGRKYEPVAIAKYEELKKCNVEQSGIVINKLKPFLGCSPDGVVDERLIEIKCPFTARNKSVCPATVPYLYEREGTHDYFYQVQGQLYCTGKQTCAFCIFTVCDFKVISVARDNVFIAKMLVQLETFFEQHFRKAVLDAFYFKYSNLYL